MQHQPLVPLSTPIVLAPHHDQAVSSALTSLSALSGNLAEQWTQARHIRPLGHICTSCGGICKGPQSDVDAVYDDHYAKGDNFDDDIDVTSFFDLIQGEPGDSQEQRVKF